MAERWRARVKGEPAAPVESHGRLVVDSARSLERAAESPVLRIAVIGNAHRDSAGSNRLSSTPIAQKFDSSASAHTFISQPTGLQSFLSAIRTT